MLKEPMKWISLSFQPSLPPPPLPPSPPSQQVVMGLLDLVVHYNPTSGGANRYSRFASEVAHKALNLMILLRPVTMVSTLAKEVAMFLASQHITHVPHSSLQPQQVWLTCMCARKVTALGVLCCFALLFVWPYFFLTLYMCIYIYTV